MDKWSRVGALIINTQTHSHNTHSLTQRHRNTHRVTQTQGSCSGSHKGLVVNQTLFLDSHRHTLLTQRHTHTDTDTHSNKYTNTYTLTHTPQPETHTQTETHTAIDTLTETHTLTYIHTFFFRKFCSHNSLLKKILSDTPQRTFL